MAQDISINLGGGNGGVTERAIQLIALLTVLSIAPSILIMMTSFTRIVVVLSLLRTALGTATAPPNSVMIALAMFLTAFVMGPVLQKSYDDGIKPLVANQIGVEDALQRASVPLRGFMQKNVREKDLKLFMDLSGEPPPATPEEMSLRILVPAFMISELKRAFEIGFLLFLPFLIIDLVVASVLMSMGMMMLPPVVVSLPFKLIFFVCWSTAGPWSPAAWCRVTAGSALRNIHGPSAGSATPLHYHARHRIQGAAPCSSHSTAPQKISATPSISNMSTCRCRTSASPRCSTSPASG
ncbi:flagellar biosynthetic protein FliP [Bradyrhizobium sp. USDA 4501]